MIKKFKVFVSPNQKELKEERLVVKDGYLWYTFLDRVICLPIRTRK